MPTLEIAGVDFIREDLGSALGHGLTASPEGGFVVVRSAGPKHWTLYHIDQHGTLSSSRTFETATPETFNYVSAASAGYLIGGSALSKDVRDDAAHSLPFKDRRAIEFDSVRTVDASGRESPALQVSDVGDSHLTSCGAETTDGFVLLGSKEAGPQIWKTLAPWIGAASKNGTRSWERTFPAVDGELIGWALGSGDPNDECEGLQIDKNGNITWAVRVESIPMPHSEEEWQKSLLFPFVKMPATLVVQLDAKGNVLREVLHPYTAAAVLLQGSNGLTLIESVTRPWARPPLTLRNRFEAGEWSIKRTPPYDPGIRIGTYDFELNEIRPPVVLKSTTLERVVAAYRTARGGVLLVGCPVNGGKHQIAYVTADGAHSPVREMNAETTQQCSQARFSQASTPDEALLLALASEGFRVTTVRFSD
jgi:hypothetical protein